MSFFRALPVPNVASHVRQFFDELQAQLRSVINVRPYTTKVYADVGNVGTGEDDLQTLTLPAEILNQDGNGLHIVAAGTVAANANSKTVKLYVNGVSATFAITTNASATHWWLELWLTRLNATNGRWFGYGTVRTGATTLEITGVSQDSSSHNWNLDSVVKCTGTATSNNDIIQKFLWVEVWR